MSIGSQSEAPSLQALLDASSQQVFDRALLEHGGVRDREIPLLAAESRSANAVHRRNATRLLSLSVSDEAVAALMDRVRDTRDPQVWALALGALLETPRAAEAAAARPELVTQAWLEDDPLLLCQGLRAGRIAGLSGVIAATERHLDHADHRVRLAAVEALASADLPRYAPRMRERFTLEPDPAVRRALLSALARDDGLESAALFRKAFADARPDQLSDLYAALEHGSQDWIADVLVEQTRRLESEPQQAFRLLLRKPDARATRACAEFLSHPVLPGQPLRWAFEVQSLPCIDHLAAITGRKLTLDEAIVAARRWLADDALVGGREKTGQSR
jgi:hypothetical protein